MRQTPNLVDKENSSSRLHGWHISPDSLRRDLKHSGKNIPFSYPWGVNRMCKEIAKMCADCRPAPRYVLENSMHEKEVPINNIFCSQAVESLQESIKVSDQRERNNTGI